MNNQRRRELAALRLKHSTASKALTDSQIKFNDGLERHFQLGLDSEPFVMGEVEGFTRQVAPNAYTTAMEIHVIKGGEMGNHLHEECRWESILWLAGYGEITYRPVPEVPYLRIVKLLPGSVLRHRADVEHNFSVDPGSRFVASFTPRFANDEAFENLTELEARVIDEEIDEEIATQAI